MTFKLHYDKEKNDRLCDPHEFYDKFEGVNYEGTILVSKNDVYYNPKKQPRTSNQSIGNVDKLKSSFINQNFNHKYRPSSADVDKVNGVYDGTAGWNRNTVYDSLNVRTFPLDLLSFDSEYDKHKYRGVSNNEEEHHTAASPMSQVAITEEIKVSLRNNWLPKTKEGLVTDATIKHEIIEYTTTVSVEGISCQTITENDRKKMLKEIRSSFPKNAKLQTYNTDIMNLAAKSLGIAYGGYNADTGKVGYLLTHTVGKDAMWFIFHANPKYSHLPVDITFVIPVPPNKKENCIKKRKKLKKSFEDAIEAKAVADSKTYDLNVTDLKEKIKNKKVNFNGFLNSYVDETEGTNGTYVLVDENGKILKSNK